MARHWYMQIDDSRVQQRGPEGNLEEYDASKAEATIDRLLTKRKETMKCHIKGCHKEAPQDTLYRLVNEAKGER